MCRKILIWLCLFVPLSGGIYAQNDPTEKPAKKDKKVKLLPLPLIGSTPETRLYFGAALLSSLDFYQDSITRLSTASLEFNYTLNKQLIFTLDGFYNTRRNDFLINFDNQVLKFPEYYWGIGNETPESNQELIQAWRIELKDILLRRVKKDFYAGLLYQMQSIFQLEYSDSSQLEQSGVTGASGGISSGIGYALYWDRRDNILNPSGGSSFLSFQHVGFSKYAGSDFGFQTIELDGRYYLHTWRDHVLAFQTYNYFTVGDPPFRMLGLLGSGSHMRGYYRGRFRDRHYLSVQAEYRLAIWRWVGMAAFAGMGDVTQDFSDLRIGNLKYFAGGALRIRMSKEDNTWLRADFSVGRQTTGFYFSFGETF